MNINTFEKLQLNEVKELIKNYCVSSLGKELIEKINPSGNFNIVKRRLKLKTSLIYLVLTMVLLQGICSTSEKIKKSMPLSKLNTENIASVKLQNFNYYDYSNNYYNITFNSIWQK